jgi:hypothetical protein
MNECDEWTYCIRARPTFCSVGDWFCDVDHRHFVWLCGVYRSYFGSCPLSCLCYRYLIHPAGGEVELSNEPVPSGCMSAMQLQKRWMFVWCHWCPPANHYFAPVSFRLIDPAVGLQFFSLSPDIPQAFHFSGSVLFSSASSYSPSCSSSAVAPSSKFRMVRENQESPHSWRSLPQSTQLYIWIVELIGIIYQL